MIELRVLGTIELRHADGRRANSVLAQPKRLALLTYLALTASPQRRDTLLALLWPELDEARARHALSQSLHVVRRGLGQGLVVTSGSGGVGLDPSRFTCDALAFEAALDAGEGERALELYGGDLAPGLHVADAPAFERWVAAERERLRAAATARALALAEAALVRSEPLEAVRLARRAGGLAPYNERAARLLLDALAAAGDRAGAVRAYESFAGRLHEELEIEPSPETRALADALRQDAPARQSPGAVADTSGFLEATPQASSPEQGAGVVEVRTPHYPTAAPAPGGAAPRHGSADGRRHRLRVIGAAAVALFVVLVAAFSDLVGPTTEAATSTTRGPVLVSQFENRTGDPELDPLGYVAADWITQGLVEAGSIPVISSLEALRSGIALRDQLRGDGTPAEVLGRELGAGTLVAGSYFVVGTELVFQVQVTDVGSGEVLAALDRFTAPVQEPSAALQALREGATGAVATFFDARMAGWTHAASMPPSLEAYRLYAEGLDRFFLDRSRNDNNMRAAAELFQRAAAADSTFTAPLIWAVYAEWQHAGGDAEDLLERLRATRDQLAPWDGAMADHVLAHSDARWSDAYHAAVRARSFAVGSEWGYKAAWVAMRAGFYRAAVDELLALDPSRGWLARWPSYWVALANAYHCLGECDKALAAARAGLEQHPRVPALERSHQVAKICLGLTHDVLASINDEIDQGGLAPSLPWYPISELSAHGHRSVAAEVGRRAVQAHLRAGGRDLKEGGFYAFAAMAAISGRAEQARPILRSHLDSLASGSIASPFLANPHAIAELRGVSGWLAARSGDAESARQILSRILQQDEPDRRVARLGPYWAAAIEAELGRGDAAIRHLERSLELGIPHYWLHYMIELDALRNHPRFQQLSRRRAP